MLTRDIDAFLAFARDCAPDFGPATAIWAHWSVTEANWTSRSGHRTCAQNSMCWRTRAALAVVVVISHLVSARRATVPSSRTKPSSRSITP